MCLCIWVCYYIFMSLCVCMYVCLFLCMLVYVYVCMHVPVYVWVCVAGYVEPVSPVNHFPLLQMTYPVRLSSASVVGGITRRQRFHGSEFMTPRWLLS